MLLPKGLTRDSKVNFVHTSSPTTKSEWKMFLGVVARLKKDFPRTEIFNVERKSLDPRYLAASENERLRKFKQAIKNATWLAPIYGGTGCADIIRYLRPEDLAALRRQRPIVNGFSDTTFLLNYLYFKLKLITFHYTNACGIFTNRNSKQFFDIISGKEKSFSYEKKSYEWLSPNRGPGKRIEGIAIGGNLETFRDLLDVCEIKPRSWEDYILFIEDIGVDLEGLHRIIISLDQKKVFMHVKAVVLGRMNEKEFTRSWLRWGFIFENKDRQIDHVFEYLISDVIEERIEDRDPLYILKVDNFGHGVDSPMIIPIGAKTILHPSGKIEFVGPFVE